VIALCKYASDWKRWCHEEEKKVQGLLRMKEFAKHKEECNLWHDAGGKPRNINREGFAWKCNCGLDAALKEYEALKGE